MNQAKSILVFIAVVATLTAGCEKKAADEIDFGSVRNSVYSNAYFGLSITLPPSWSIQDQEARQRLMDMGGKMVAGDDKNLKAAVKAAEMTTVNLLSVFKHPMGAPVPCNPNIMCIAEQVRHMPGISKGTDYLYHARRALEASQMQASVLEEESTESIGGHDFNVMHIELSLGNLTVHQKYYAAIMKGYALVFIVSYTTDDDQSALKDILKTVTFKL